VRHIVPAAASVILCVAVADLMFFQLRQNAVVSLEKWRTPPRTAVMLRPDADAFRIYTLGAEQTHVNAYMRAAGWEGSLAPFIEQREFLQPSLNVLFGLSTPNGYAQLTPAPTVEVWGDQNGPGLFNSLKWVSGNYFVVRPPFRKLLGLHNVKTVLTPLPIIGEQFIPRGTVGQVRLYENPDVLPRAFVVGSYRVAADEAKSLSLVSGVEFTPSREAILLENPGFAPHDSIAASASLLSERTNEVTVRTESSAQGLLVLSDTYYPGWQAEVDGREAAVLRANHTMRAVVVPAGSHTVRFQFRPRSVFVGFFLTLAGMVAMGMMMAFPGRRTR
jgi:hypothetical protein